VNTFFQILKPYHYFNIFSVNDNLRAPSSHIQLNGLLIKTNVFYLKMWCRASSQKDLSKFLYTISSLNDYFFFVEIVKRFLEMLY